MISKWWRSCCQQRKKFMKYTKEQAIKIIKNIKSKVEENSPDDEKRREYLCDCDIAIKKIENGAEPYKELANLLSLLEQNGFHVRKELASAVIGVKDDEALELLKAAKK